MVLIWMLSQSRRGMVSSTSALSRPKLKKKERLAVFPCRMERTPLSDRRASSSSASPVMTTSASGSSSRLMVTSPLMTCTSMPLISGEGKAVPVRRRLRPFSQKKPPRSLL